MTASDHVTELLSSCTKLLYALRVLRAHGMSQQSLMDVFRATVESKLQNALVLSLVLSRLNYCNVVLAGLPASIHCSHCRRYRTRPPDSYSVLTVGHISPRHSKSYIGYQ